MLPDQAVSWVTGVIGAGSRVAWGRRLRRGSWHVNHAMDVIDSRGRTHRVVLRRWARPGWEDDDPDYTVEREVHVLGLLRPAPVPAPEVIAADPAGSQCDVPAILLTRLPGHSPRPADIPGRHRRWTRALTSFGRMPTAPTPACTARRRSEARRPGRTRPCGQLDGGPLHVVAHRRCLALRNGDSVSLDAGEFAAARQLVIGDRRVSVLRRSLTQCDRY
jgi:Phosphotransferase enzyme family